MVIVRYIIDAIRLALVFLALCIGLLLVSCGIPVTLSVQGDQGAYSFSAKRGFEITIQPTK